MDNDGTSAIHSQECRHDYKQQMVHQLYTEECREVTCIMDRANGQIQATDGTSAIHSQECREVTCIMDRANGQ